MGVNSGQTSVQKASTEFGIPTGTLYGRCKREGIELSRSNPTPWSEDAMGEALEAVRLGHMSINQAAIHYNLPYSSLYGRFKRGIKYDSDNIEVSPWEKSGKGDEGVVWPDPAGKRATPAHGPAQFCRFGVQQWAANPIPKPAEQLRLDHGL